MKGNTKKAISFYLTIIAAILSVVGVVLYGSVMYRLTEVYYMLIAAIVLAVIAIVLPMVIGDKAVFNLIPVLNAVLMASAIVWGTNLMVNQLGYVYAGLDGIDTIMSYIYYVVVTAISMLLNIVASFLPMAKEAA